jgi:hypothetical protein
MIDVCPTSSTSVRAAVHAPQYFVLLFSPSLRILFSAIALATAGDHLFLSIFNALRAASPLVPGCCVTYAVMDSTTLPVPVLFAPGAAFLLPLGRPRPRLTGVAALARCDGDAVDSVRMSSRLAPRMALRIPWRTGRRRCGSGCGGRWAWRGQGRSDAAALRGHARFAGGTDLDPSRVKQYLTVQAEGRHQGRVADRASWAANPVSSTLYWTICLSSERREQRDVGQAQGGRSKLRMFAKRTRSRA